MVLEDAQRGLLRRNDLRHFSDESVGLSESEEVRRMKCADIRILAMFSQAFVTILADRLQHPVTCVVLTRLGENQRAFLQKCQRLQSLGFFTNRFCSFYRPAAAKDGEAAEEGLQTQRKQSIAPFDCAIQTRGVPVRSSGDLPALPAFRANAATSPRAAIRALVPRQVQAPGECRPDAGKSLRWSSHSSM
jgi:hypothetical protein